MTKRKQKIAAIVVTFNRLDQLKKTIKRLRSEQLDNIVIVDNSSTDGTADWLKRLDGAEIHTIRLKENKGGAGGFEAGLREAISFLSTDWFVLMDDDARPERGAIQEFRKNLPSPNSCVAAAVYQPNGAICDMNRPWYNPVKSTQRLFWTILNRSTKEFHLSDQQFLCGPNIEIHGASFVGLFVSADVFYEVGFPDERYFIYGDDVIFTTNILNSGRKIEFWPKVRFQHDCPRVVHGKPLQPVWKNYYRFRNAWYVNRYIVGAILGRFIFVVQFVRWAMWSLLDLRYGNACLTRTLFVAICDVTTGRLDRTHSDILRICSR